MWVKTGRFCVFPEKVQAEFVEGRGVGAPCFEVDVAQPIIQFLCSPVRERQREDGFGRGVTIGDEMTDPFGQDPGFPGPWPGDD